MYKSFISSNLISKTYKTIKICSQNSQKKDLKKVIQVLNYNLDFKVKNTKLEKICYHLHIFKLLRLITLC